jgi:hypothetical protein
MHVSRIGTAAAAGILALLAPLAVLDAVGRPAGGAVVSAGAPTAVAAPSDTVVPPAPLDVTWGP